MDSTYVFTYELVVFSNVLKRPIVRFYKGFKAYHVLRSLKNKSHVGAAASSSNVVENKLGNLSK